MVVSEARLDNSTQTPRVQDDGHKAALQRRLVALLPHHPAGLQDEEPIAQGVIDSDRDENETDRSSSEEETEQHESDLAVAAVPTLKDFLQRNVEVK